MKLDEIAVVVPRKEGTSASTAEVLVWPLVQRTLDLIEAGQAVREATELAIATSDGCCALANYFNSEAKRVHKMDYSFKVPLIVLAAKLAQDDEGADSYYCPTEGAIYFETDNDQFSFHVHKDWTVEWPEVADEVVDGYEWDGVDQQAWALERLLSYSEPDLEKYRPDSDDDS